MVERVLIIDDEENIREMIRLTLETAGYEVSEAADGLEAFALLGGDASWSVVLLDQRMPGMEGTDVLRRLKVLIPSASVVMMTAFASVELAVDTMKLGATDFLRKPMTPEVVRNAVAAALRKRQDKLAYVAAQKHQQQLPRTVTLNGFTIVADESTVLPDKRNKRRFLVKGPHGDERPVVIEILDEAIAAVEQAVHDRQIEDTFWTEQAQQFLSDFIWNDGNVPGSGKLVLKSAASDALEKFAGERRKNEQTHSDC